MQKNANSQDEIDVFDLLASIYALLRKNILLVIALPLLGVLIAYFVKESSYSDPRFTSSMMLVTDILSKNEADFLMVELSRADSFPGLSREQRSDLRSFSHDSGSTMLNDRVFLLYLIIRVTVTNEEMLPALQQSVLTYLESSEPVVRQKSNNKVYYADVIKKIDQELDSLDQVKRSVTSVKKGPYQGPPMPYLESVELYDKKKLYELEIAKKEEIEVVLGFNSAIKVKTNKYLLLLGFIGGAFLVALILFLKNFIRYYKKRYPTTG